MSAKKKGSIVRSKKKVVKQRYMNPFDIGEQMEVDSMPSEFEYYLERVDAHNVWY